MKDPAFLFYPGDYLRDTQCLGESAQVAYDRIMCEHMRNICISKQQLKFFTKRLSEDEIEELKMVLSEVDGGYQITWVAESIVKRREYSDSRRKNRTKNKKDIKNISKSYDKHMENENENENIDTNTSLIKKDKNKIPEFEEFFEYAKTLENYSTGLDFTIKAKYDSWFENNWKDGNGNKIKNWKTKLRNTWPHLKPMYKPKEDGRISSKQYFRDLQNGIGLIEKNNKDKYLE